MDAVEVVQNAEWETGKSFLSRLETTPVLEAAAELEVLVLEALVLGALVLEALLVLAALVLEALVLEAATLLSVVLTIFVLEVSTELDTVVETARIPDVTVAEGTAVDDSRTVVETDEPWEIRECGLHVLLW